MAQSHPDELILSDFVDGALESPEYETAIEAHLRACATCRALADEFRAIRAAAAALPPLAPPARTWTRIEEAISADALSRRPPGGWSARWTWLAAAAALVLATLVGMRWSLPSRSTPPAAADLTADTALQIQAELLQAEQHYQKAITLLEGIAKASEGALDAQTVAALESNLMAVDRAIAESRTALRSDPTNASAQRSLLDGYKAKLAMLEDAVALIDRAREDQAPDRPAATSHS
jgi:tetratricopeptide (TPR) repeat protein